MRMNENNWELIGVKGGVVGSKCVNNVPRWVLRAYKECDEHHDGVVYHFNGKHYQYKVVESGQGGGDRVFYRRLQKYLVKSA